MATARSTVRSPARIRTLFSPNSALLRTASSAGHDTPFLLARPESTSTVVPYRGGHNKHYSIGSAHIGFGPSQSVCNLFGREGDNDTLDGWIEGSSWMKDRFHERILDDLSFAASQQGLFFGLDKIRSIGVLDWTGLVNGIMVWHVSYGYIQTS